MRFLILWGAVLLFIGLWIWFFWDIWSHHPKTAVSLNSKALYISSVLGGILGTFFGIAMGVERKDPSKDASTITPGATLLGSAEDETGLTDTLATFAVWGYALVGLAAVVTSFVKSAQSPASVEALASVFGGFLLAIVTAAFAPGQATSPPSPPPPSPPPAAPPVEG